MRGRRRVDRDKRRPDGRGLCHGRGSRLRFLDSPSIEPTNNRADRTPRPAVLARKVSQCTRTVIGTRTLEAWTSELRTLTRTASQPEVPDAVVRPIHPANARPL